MTNKEAIKHLEFIKLAAQIDAKPIGIQVEAFDLAIKALELADEVDKAAENISARYYGSDNCSRCKHLTEAPENRKIEGLKYCKQWGINVDLSDTCHYYEEVKHGN